MSNWFATYFKDRCSLTTSRTAAFMWSLGLLATLRSVLRLRFLAISSPLKHNRIANQIANNYCQIVIFIITHKLKITHPFHHGSKQLVHSAHHSLVHCAHCAEWTSVHGAQWAMWTSKWVGSVDQNYRLHSSRYNTALKWESGYHQCTKLLASPYTMQYNNTHFAITNKICLIYFVRELKKYEII